MKETTKSPAQRIYMLYGEYEKRGIDTSIISRAIQKATGTSGKSNLEVVNGWLEEMKDNEKSLSY